MRFGPSLRKLALVTLALIAHGAAGGSAALAQSPKEAARPAPLRIAVFVDNGTGESREKVIAALRGGTDAEGAIEIVRVKADEIRAGKLEADGISVLVHPGGSGSKQGEALGSEGREAVRDFVADGGGYRRTHRIARGETDWWRDEMPRRLGGNTRRSRPCPR